MWIPLYSAFNRPRDFKRVDILDLSIVRCRLARLRRLFEHFWNSRPQVAISILRCILDGLPSSVSFLCLFEWISSKNSFLQKIAAEIERLYFIFDCFLNLASLRVRALLVVRRANQVYENTASLIHKHCNLMIWKQNFRHYFYCIAKFDQTTNI